MTPSTTNPSSRPTIPETFPGIAVGMNGHERSIEELRSTGYGQDYWGRTWGGRGLLYVWSDRAAPAGVRGLGDGQWRPAEMCLKVAARRDLPREELP